jgi:hypothetical protein
MYHVRPPSRFSHRWGGSRAPSSISYLPSESSRGASGKLARERRPRFVSLNAYMSPTRGLACLGSFNTG